MPIKIKDVDDGLGTLIIGAGVIGADEFLNAFHNQLIQPAEKRMKYLYSLLDFTGVTRMDLTLEAIHTFSEMCKRSSVVTYGNLIAVVADKDLESGFSPVWEVLGQETDWDIRVFREAEDAKTWIKASLKDKWHLADLTFD